MFSERETAGRMDLVGISCFLTVEVVALFLKERKNGNFLILLKNKKK
jgi:hypothetical protein